MSAGGPSKDQREELQEIFNYFDKNKTGEIEIESVMQYFETLKLNERPGIAEKSDREGDEKKEPTLTFDNGKRTINFEEFYQMMSDAIYGETADTHLKETFSIFDTNGTGYIEFENLKNIVGVLGDNLTEEDIKGMIRAVDYWHNGKICYEEFKEFFYKDLD
mmetsp:Transcript_1047/g.1108  ORF Transcript_1047/g.1108 Transcript_1047/m.1108 type:complete len:162 (-) Transcript_1047:178-663(-)